MSKIAIFNIGNRDVQIREAFSLPDGKEFSLGIIPPIEAREMGKRLLDFIDGLPGPEARDILFNKLEYPILEKALRDVKLSGMEWIYLVVSDQDSPRNNQDTLYYGKIIEKYLNLKKADPRSDFGQNQGCKISQMTTGLNPADIDDMNEFYKKILRQISRKHRQTSQVYICLSGGTQAMNSMMLINGVDIFKHRLEVLYVLTHHARPTYLSIGKDLQKNLIKERLLSALESRDYHAAYQLLQDHQDIFEDSRDFTKLAQGLRYAHARVSFDFDAADEFIKPCITLSKGQERAAFQDLQQQIQFEEGHTELYYFLELKENAKYHVDRGEYIDFLGRIFRMQEAAFGLLAQGKGVVLDKKRPRIDKDWLAQNPDLIEYLNSYKTRNGAQLIYQDRDVNRTIYEAVLSFFAKEDQELRAVLEALDYIEKLANLRNNTPLAHGYRGVSQRIIEEEYGDSLEELLSNLDVIAEKVCLFLGQTAPSRAFFEDFDNLAREIIDRL